MKLWIARDENNSLNAFIEKPTLLKAEYISSFWHTNNGYAIEFYEELFPEVTFENSPQQIEINLVK